MVLHQNETKATLRKFTFLSPPIPGGYLLGCRTIAKTLPAGSQFFKQAGKHIRPGWCLIN